MSGSATSASALTSKGSASSVTSEPAARRAPSTAGPSSGCTVRREASTYPQKRTGSFRDRRETTRRTVAVASACQLANRVVLPAAAGAEIRISRAWLPLRSVATSSGRDKRALCGAGTCSFVVTAGVAAGPGSSVLSGVEMAAAASLSKGGPAAYRDGLEPMGYIATTNPTVPVGLGLTCGMRPSRAPRRTPPSSSVAHRHPRSSRGAGTHRGRWPRENGYRGSALRRVDPPITGLDGKGVLEDGGAYSSRSSRRCHPRSS